MKKLLVLIILSIIVFNSCKTKRSELSGNKVRFWLQQDKSVYKEIRYRYGRAFFSNNLGIYYYKVDGTEYYNQPDLYDAHPDKISQSLFQWEIKHDSLYFKANDYTSKYRIIQLTNDTLILENHGDTINYEKQEEFFEK